MTSQERDIRNWLAAVLVALGVIVIVWQGHELTQARREAQIANEAKRLERFRAELILASSPFGFIMCDDEQKIVFANDAAERLLGWSTGSLHGQPVDVMIPQNKRDAHFRASSLAAREMLAAKENYVVRKFLPGTHALKKNGEVLTVDIGLQAIKYGALGHESVEFIAAIKPTDMTQVPQVVPLPPIEKQIEKRREEIEDKIKQKVEAEQ